MTPWAKLKSLLNTFHLELFMLLVAIGNSFILHEAATKMGMPDSWQTQLAIYATELIIVRAGSWGVAGLVMAFVMFSVGTYSISLAYPTHWLASSYYGITIFVGTIGNFIHHERMRMSNTKALNKDSRQATIPVSAQGVLAPDPIKKMSVNQIRLRFKLSHRKAREMKEAAIAGQPITLKWIEENQSTTPAGPVPSSSSSSS